MPDNEEVNQFVNNQWDEMTVAEIIAMFGEGDDECENCRIEYENKEQKGD